MPPCSQPAPPQGSLAGAITRGGEAPPRRMKVIDVEDSAGDLDTLTPDEVSDLAADVPGLAPLARPLGDLARAYARIAGAISVPASEVESLVLRALLAFPEVVPMVTAPRGNPGISGPAQVRPAAATRGVAAPAKTPTGVAAEAPVDVVGLFLDQGAVGARVAAPVGAPRRRRALEPADADALALLREVVDANRDALRSPGIIGFPGPPARGPGGAGTAPRRVDTALEAVEPPPAVTQALEKFGVVGKRYAGAQPAVADLLAVGGVAAVLYALAEGPDPPGLAEIVARRGDELRDAEALLRAKALRDAQRSKLLRLRMIVEDVLGRRRLAAIDGGGAVLETPEALLDALSPKERGLVATDYANRVAEAEGAANNACPHVELERRLRRAATDREALALFKQLRRFMPARGRPPPDAFIACDNCKYRLVCPHVVRMFELRAEGAPPAKARRAIEPFAARGGGDRFEYFCRVCSERLYGYAAPQPAASDYGEFGGAVRRALFGAAAAASEAVRADFPVGRERFARLAVDAALGPLLDATSRAKARRRAETPDDEATPMEELLAVVYAYAFVLTLVATGSAEKQKKTRVGFEGVRPGAAVSQYVRAILGHVMRRHGRAVAAVDGAGPEYVAQKFREAFRALRGERGFRLVAASGARTVANEFVALAPEFDYAVAAARLGGGLAAGAGAAKVFRAAVGLPFEALARAEADPQREKDLARVLDWREVPGANLLQKIWRPPAAAAAKDPFLSAYGAFAEYVSARGPGAEARMARALAASEGRRRARAAGARRSYVSDHHASTLRTSTGPAPITYLYDEEGRRHTWTARKGAPADGATVYVYRVPGRKKPVEASRAEIVAALGRGEPLAAGGRLVDLRCGVCGALRSGHAGLDARKVRAALAAREAVAIFFAYFSARCPEGDRHEFPEGRDACAKCGATYALMQAGARGDREEPGVAAFEAKYRAAYERAVAELDRAARGDPEAAPAEPAPPAAEPAPAPAPAPSTDDCAAALDYGELARAAKAAGVEARELEALGAVERRPYAEALADLPPPPAAANDPRLFGAHVAALKIIRAYNRLRFAGNFPRVPRELDPFLSSELRVNPALLAGLPPAPPDYARCHRALVAAGRFADAFGLSLGAIARVAAAGDNPGFVGISAGSDLRGAAEKFGRAAVAELVRSNSLLAKNGAFDFALFGGRAGDAAPAGLAVDADPARADNDDDGEASGSDPFRNPYDEDLSENLEGAYDD